MEPAHPQGSPSWQTCGSRASTIARDEVGHGTAHRLTTAIPYTQCDHCHNRGTYSLKQMAFLPREDLPPVGQPIPATMPPEGKRLKEYYQPMTEFTKCEVDLDCVDCHNRPTHIFESPNFAVNLALDTKRLDHKLPNIKANGVKVLTAEYKTTPEAVTGISQQMWALYDEKNFPDTTILPASAGTSPGNSPPVCPSARSRATGWSSADASTWRRATATPSA